MNSTKKAYATVEDIRALGPLPVTMEVDGESWQWTEARPGLMCVPLPDLESMERLMTQRDRLSEAARRRRPIRMNGREVVVSSMGPVMHDNGGGEFTLTVLAWKEPKASTKGSTSPTFRIDVAPLASAAVAEQARQIEAMTQRLIEAWVEAPTMRLHVEPLTVEGDAVAQWLTKNAAEVEASVRSFLEGLALGDATGEGGSYVAARVRDQVARSRAAGTVEAVHADGAATARIVAGGNVGDLVQVEERAPCDGCGARPVQSDGPYRLWHTTHRDDCPHVDAAILAAGRPKLCTCLHGPCRVAGDAEPGGCGYDPAAWDRWEAAEERQRARERAKEAEARRAREAPLVALVAAVPEGLDPNGWRAAVLAIKESMGAIFDDATMKAIRWRKSDEAPPHKLGSVERQIREGEEGIALRAYRRAVAPQGPRPSPERKGATWRERGPRIVVDHGED